MRSWALLLIIIFVLCAAGFFGYAGWLAYDDAGGNVEKMAKEAGWQILLIPAAVITGIIVLLAIFSKGTARMGQHNTDRHADREMRGR
jgi:TRAP-type C4-dicarboxylate transport system permease small subunit